MIKFLDRLQRVIGAISGWTGAICMFSIVALVSVDVMGRFLLSKPTGISEEVSSYLLVGVTFLAGAYAFIKGAHVNVDLFLNKLKPGPRRMLLIGNGLVAVAACAMLAWYGTGLVLKAIQINSHSPSLLAVPMVYPLLLVPLGLILLAVTILAYTVRLFIAPAEGIESSYDCPV